MDWDKLRVNIKNNNCVAIIGAGASVPHIPRARQLAAQLIRSEKTNPFTDRKGKPVSDAEKRSVEDLAAVAQFLAVKHTQGEYPKFLIADIIREKSLDPKWRRYDPHRALANLDLPIYITTNYDNRMKLALQMQNKPVETAICKWSDEPEVQNARSLLDPAPGVPLYDPSPSHPLVFHLHGQMEIPKSIVASEDDYLDFLVEMGRQNRQTVESGSHGYAKKPLLPPVIQNALASKLLLFVGYGIADTNFRVILRSLKSSLRSSAKNSIAVQYAGEQRDEMKAYLQQYFQWMLDLDIFWGSSEDFAKALTEQAATWK